MKKIIYYLLSTFIIFIIVLSLIYNKYSSDNDNKIVVAEVTHSVFYTPFYVAIEKGYFDDLQIELLLTPGADKVSSALLSKSADIGLAGLESTIYVYNNLKDDYLVNFAALTKRDGQFLFGKCNSDFTLEELKGKTILVGRKTGMPAMVFTYALYKEGITDVVLNNDVEFANLSSAYISGEGDYVNLFEPTAYSIEEKGYGCTLLSVGKIAGTLPYTVFNTRKSYLKDNAETIKKFVKGINKGLKYVKENDPSIISNVISSQFPELSNEELTEVIKRYKEADSWWDNTYIEKDAYNNLLDIMSYNNAIEERIDFNILVDNSLNHD